MFKRVVLFIATNLAVILVLSIVLRLLGVDRILDESGTGINYESLLILSLVIGFGGSFISLAISKWMAKRTTGARVITNPSNNTEAWLVGTVQRLSQQAGIDIVSDGEFGKFRSWNFYVLARLGGIEERDIIECFELEQVAAQL